MGGAAPRPLPLADRRDIDPPEGRSRRRRGGWWIAIAVVGLLLLGRLFAEDGSVSVRPEDTDEEVRTVGSLVTSPPKPRRAKVTVEVEDGVVDGQIVEVQGTGFDDDAEVEIRQCAGRLGCTRLEPIERSGEVGTYRTSFHTDEAGTFTARVAVRRYVVGPEGEPPVDCSGPSGADSCNLTTVVYFTGRSQYPDPVPLHFSEGNAARPRPTVVADATSGLVPRQKVRLVGLGFIPGSTVLPMLCPTSPGDECLVLTATRAVEPVRTDTTVEVEVAVPMTAENLDCQVPRSCALTLTPQSSGGFPTPAPLPVSFAVP